MAHKSKDLPSPEPIHWSQRMLPMKEAFVVSGRSSSSYYRDVQEGRMPAPVPVGGSSRIPGWELLKAITKLISERDDVEAGVMNRTMKNARRSEASVIQKAGGLFTTCSSRTSGKTQLLPDDPLIDNEADDRALGGAS